MRDYVMLILARFCWRRIDAHGDGHSDNEFCINSEPINPEYCGQQICTFFIRLGAQNC
jgi:hypothetical protein